MNTAMIPHIAPSPEEPELSYRRVACGVITQYEIYSNGHWQLVELFHGAVERCTCHLPQCQHGKLALHLEEHYQASHKSVEPAYCCYCGYRCCAIDDVAICPACS